MTWLTGYGYRASIPYSAPAKWVGSHAYSKGDIVVPLTRNGYIYACTVAGSSSSGEPTWSTVLGDTVVDSGATWTCIITDSYPISLAVDNTTASNSAGNIHCNGHCVDITKDIRFTQSDGTTLLNFYRETAVGSWWVQVIAHPDYSAYIYCGKESDTDASNGTNTFTFFDDFEGGDLSKWTTATGWANSTNQAEEGTHSAYGAYHSPRYPLLKTLTLRNCEIMFWIRTDSVDEPSGQADGIYALDSQSSYVRPCGMGAYQGGHFGYNDGTANNKNLPTDKTFAVNTWYKYHVAVDFVNSLFRWLYVKDGAAGTAELVDDAGNTLGSADTLSNIGSRTGGYSDSGNIYVDQYIVKNYVYPEPAWETPGTEEVAATCVAGFRSLFAVWLGGGGFVSKKIDIDSASVSVSTTPISVLYNRSISIEYASVSISPTAITVNRTYVIPISSVSVAADATNIALTRGYELLIGSVSVTPSLTNITVDRTYIASIEYGTIGVSLDDINLEKDSVIPIASENVSTSLQNIALLRGYAASIESILTEITDTPIALLYDRLLCVDSYAISVVPTDIYSNRTYIIGVNYVSVGVNFSAISIDKYSIIYIDSESVSIIDYDLELHLVSIAHISISTEGASVSGTDIAFNRTYVIAVGYASTLVETQPVLVLRIRSIDIEVGSVDVALQDIGFIRNYVISIEPISVGVSTQTLAFNSTYIISVANSSVLVDTKLVIFRRTSLINVESSSVSIDTYIIGVNKYINIVSSGLSVSLTDIKVTSGRAIFVESVSLGISANLFMFHDKKMSINSVGCEVTPELIGLVKLSMAKIISGSVSISMQPITVDRTYIFYVDSTTIVTTAPQTFDINRTYIGSISSVSTNLSLTDIYNYYGREISVVNASCLLSADEISMLCTRIIGIDTIANSVGTITIEFIRSYIAAINSEGVSVSLIPISLLMNHASFIENQLVIVDMLASDLLYGHVLAVDSEPLVVYVYDVYLEKIKYVIMVRDGSTLVEALNVFLNASMLIHGTSCSIVCQDVNYIAVYHAYIQMVTVAVMQGDVVLLGNHRLFVNGVEVASVTYDMPSSYGMAIAVIPTSIVISISGAIIWSTQDIYKEVIKLYSEVHGVDAWKVFSHESKVHGKSDSTSVIRNTYERTSPVIDVGKVIKKKSVIKNVCNEDSSL